MINEYDEEDCKHSWELDPPKKAVEIVKLLNSYECERVNSKGETALMAGINNIVEFQHVFAPLFKDQLGMQDEKGETALIRYLLHVNRYDPYCDHSNPWLLTFFKAEHKLVRKDGFTPLMAIMQFELL